MDEGYFTIEKPAAAHKNTEAGGGSKDQVSNYGNGRKVRYLKDLDTEK